MEIRSLEQQELIGYKMEKYNKSMKIKNRQAPYEHTTGHVNNATSNIQELQNT